MPPINAVGPRAERPGQHDKSPASASLLSVGGTVTGAMLSIGLMSARDLSWSSVVLSATMLSIAPGFGHLYAGEGGHAALTTLGRGLSLLALGYGFAKTESSSVADELLLLGLGGYSTLTVYDWIDASYAVRRERARVNVSLAPLVSSNTTGLVLGGTF